jgi:GDP-L-fucose synthase
MSFYANKKVLVAGGTGTMGIPLVKRLIALGADVTVASLDYPEYAKLVLDPKAHFVRTDLTEYANCLEVCKGKDHVFNLVGIKGSVGIGETKVATYFVPMLRFQTNLMDAAFHAGASRYLFISSICVYPPGEFHEEDNAWNGLPKQNDRYPGLAKRIGEIQGETYLHEFGWDAVRIIRPSNVYGPFDDFNAKTAQVVPALIRRMIDGENPVKIWGDGSAIRDFIFSEDVVDGILIAVEKAPACLPINIGSGRRSSIKELAETIAQNIPISPSLAWDPSGPVGDQVRLLSTERAKSVIGFTAKTSLADGIQKTMQWYRENTELANKRSSILEIMKKSESR